MKTILNSTLLLLAVILLISNTSYSQERTITGKVTTFDIIPLQAQILVFSSNEVVLTNDSGQFTINCMQKDKIKVSAKGFIPKKVKLKKKISILSVDLVCQPNQDIKKVIPIGYGHVLDEAKVNSVSSVRDQRNDFSKYSDMYTLIRNRFPNVRVDGNEIIIQGESSFFMSNSALIVLDGVITDNSILGSLRPSDVKKISILKNGSMYGSRGANGVIIIETK